MARIQRRSGRFTHTPAVALPDHHTLGIAVTQSADPRPGALPGAVPLQTLTADAAHALSNVFTTIPNTHRQP